MVVLGVREIHVNHGDQFRDCIGSGMLSGNCQFDSLTQCFYTFAAERCVSHLEFLLELYNSGAAVGRADGAVQTDANPGTDEFDQFNFPAGQRIRLRSCE